jgi:late competence protein required for DNA uptake (superfamily II DNA/RNA helicase)
MTMSDAHDELRNGLLLDALGKPLDLNVVDRHVRHRNPSASATEIQNETLELIRAVVSDGLFSLGAVGNHDERFVAWKGSLDHSMHKISHSYVKHYDDPERWMFAAWLSLTGKGELLARSIEEKDIDGYRSPTT